MQVEDAVMSTVEERVKETMAPVPRGRTPATC